MLGLDYKTSIPCCRWSEGPAHPSEASSPPPHPPNRRSRRLDKWILANPSLKSKMLRVSLRTHGANCKLGSIRKIGARADLIGRPAVNSLRMVISFFPTHAVTTTFHCREFSFHPQQQCLCHPSHDLKNRSNKGKNGIS